MSPILGQSDHIPAAQASLAGILAVLVEFRQVQAADDKGREKVEVLLDRAGLTAEDIEAVTGKSVGAIKKSVQRARKS